MKLLGTLFVLLLIPVLGTTQTTHLDSLSKQFEMAKEPGERMKFLRLIAADLHDAEEKIATANQLLELANEYQEYYFIHAAQLQLGMGYRQQGRLSKSLEHLLLALEIANTQQDPKLLGETYGEISTTYASQGDVRSSVHFINKAIEIFKQQKDTLNLSIALLNTGYDYYTLNELDSSLIYGEEAEYLVTTYKNINDRLRKSLLAYIRGNKGITEAAIGETDKGIQALKTSIASLRALEDYYAIADFSKFLGEIEFDKGELVQAEKHAFEALELAEAYGMQEIVRDINLLLYKINLSRNNSAKALNYHLAYSALADSIENKNVIREMAQQRTAFELAQKESEVELLKAQKQNQQAVVVIATVVVFAFAILVIVIFIYYRSKIRINRVLTRQKTSLERLNETKDKFFSIISHDLRGPISSLMGVSHLIRHFVEEDNDEQLMQMADHMEMTVEQLTVLLDNLLNWAMQQQGHFPNVPEKVELNSMLHEIVGMFSNMAAGKKIELSAQIEYKIDLWVDRNSVHTIFRNLINNAIKFTNEGGVISAIAFIEDEFAEIQVKDTGIGMSQEKLKRVFNLTGDRATYGTAGEKGLGLGLQLVNEFVKMNRGKIDVNSIEGEGTTFRVRLPLFDKESVQETVNS